MGKTGILVLIGGVIVFTMTCITINELFVYSGRKTGGQLSSLDKEGSVKRRYASFRDRRSSLGSNTPGGAVLAFSDDEADEIRAAIVKRLRENAQRQERYPEEENTDSDLSENDAPEENNSSQPTNEVEKGDGISPEELEARFRNSEEDTVQTEQAEKMLFEKMEELMIPTHLLSGIKCRRDSCRVEFDVTDVKHALSLNRLIEDRSPEQYTYDVVKNGDGRPEKVVAFFSRDGYRLSDVVK